MKNNQVNKIIVIGGGSFQGKSLIALHIAYKFKIPSIICTDTVRSILHVLNPTAPYFFTSTYLMPPEDLVRQMKEVSDVSQKLLSIFEKRGEGVVIEGMHISPDFLTYLSNKSNTLIFCIDNKLPLKKRLEYKSLTRHRVEYHDPETGIIAYGPLTKTKLHIAPYVQHANRIEEIHKEIIEYFSRRTLPIIEFSNINTAIKAIDTMIAKNMRPS